MSTEKSDLRKILEQLEDDIHKSMLRDLDKVSELKKINCILKNILNSDSIESYFPNHEDFDYFIRRFSHEVIKNILKQYYVYGEDGDDVALEVLFNYVQILIKFIENQTYSPLFESIREIFDPTKYFFKGPSYNLKCVNERKLMNQNKFNELLPKKVQNEMKFKVGDEIDVLVDLRRSYNPNHEKKIWVRGRIVGITDTFLQVYTAEESHPLFFSIQSFEYTEKGKMTPDYEWRINLKKDDMVDGYDRSKWHPSTILAVKSEIINGLPKVDVRIGFRVYSRLCPNWEIYKRIWPDKYLSKDSNNEEYFGDVESMDETLPSYSKRIMPLNSMNANESKSEENENYSLDENIIFDHEGKKNYIIARNSTFSYYFAQLLTKIIDNNGFNTLIDLFIRKDRPSPESVQWIFHILGQGFSLLHKDYVWQIGLKLKEGILNYFSDFNEKEVRNIKKETFDSILRVLKTILTLTIEPEERNNLLEKINISFATKMLKTNFLDKRIQAVKTLIDIIKTSKRDSNKNEFILKLIEESQIFNEIYGPNSHIQLINKSKDLLEIMLQEDKLSDEEMELIWSATKIGDLEGKLTILKTFKELSKVLKPKHITSLLKNVYSSTGEDVIIEEIELIFELSNHPSQSTSTLEKCIRFFTESVLLSKIEENEKINVIINKIFEITKDNQSFKELVLTVSLNCLKKNENVILALRLISKFIESDFISKDVETRNILFSSNNLIKLFTDNFIEYSNSIREKMKSWNQSIELLPIDNFPHSQHLTSRLKFVNLLIVNRLWDSESIEPLEFLYGILVVNSCSEQDNVEFYRWVKSIIDKRVDSNFEEKIFKIFNEKVCKDTKSIHLLSIEAFDSYLKVFLNINQNQGNLLYAKNESKSQKGSYYLINVYADPESLIGFDILWKIVFDSFSEEIMNKGIETLHLLYTNIKLVDENLNQKLLKKCVDLIHSQANSSISNEEKYNKIVKCLKVLKLMIEESEKRGTVRVKSHAGLLKNKVINLKVDAPNYSYIFFIKLYVNTTMWDLKEILAKKIGICVDFLKFSINKIKEIENIDHGKTIMEMNINELDLIKISRNALDLQIPQAELVINGEITPDCLKVFNDWYDFYSTDDKMGREDCARFVKAVTSTKEDIPVDDIRIKGLFESYDKNHDGILDRDDFVGFYIECALKPDKRKVVWENMKQMGIRNDLKRIDEPYETYNTDKNQLPRFILANNEQFFSIIFSLLDLNESIAKEASNFLYVLSTNPCIYKDILFGIINNKNINWEQQLDPKNLFKLIYSLKIIESFLEDIEIDSNDIDGFSNEESIVESYQNPEEIKQKKIQWMENFVLKGGVNHLVRILNVNFKDFASSLTNNDGSSMFKTSIIYILRILRILYFSSLNKFEKYRNLNSNLKSVETPVIDLKNKSSSSFDLNEVQNIFSGEIGTLVYESLDYQLLFDLFLKSLLSLIVSDIIDNDNINLIEINFDFLTGILSLSLVSDDLENKLKKERREDFEKIIYFGILNSNFSIRSIFSKSLIRLIRLCNELKRYELISFIFSISFNFISKLTNDQRKFSSELFEFSSFIFEIFFLNEKEINIENTEENPKDYFMKLVTSLDKDINEDDEKPLSNELFIGYLKIINRVCNSVDEIKEYISNNFNLLEGIMTKVLFTQTKNNNLKVTDQEFINPDKFDDSKSNRNSNVSIRKECYNFILAILKGKIHNFEKFFSVNLLESPKEEVKSKDLYYKYTLSNSYKNEGYVGLRNLSSICYMNSMLQQFFNVPAFRYLILQVNDQEHPQINPQNQVDDNFLHQVQRMFSFLDLSQRQDYNPFGFCYSFKDFDGKPTDVRVQQDSQEFLNRFFDKIDESIKPTESKYVLYSVFGGKTCSQLICENGCGSVKNRFEDFYNLSLEVNNMKNLNDSLEKFISPERIEGFKCETCNKNVTITKRNSLAELPNVLIIHLQRIFYNYEIDKNEKINSRLEFPKTLNLKNYTIEELTRRNVAGKSKGSTYETAENFETDDIYFKNSSYYEYHLVGTVVHTGTAETGHYFSYINTFRGGNDLEMDYNPQDEQHVNSWLEFNDSYVRKFNINKLEDECFGGSDASESDNSWGMKMEKSRNAYMLVYERRLKNPIKMKISPENISNSKEIISFKEGEFNKIKKQFDFFRNVGYPEAQSIYKSLIDSTFYDVAKNEYFYYKPYFSTERLIPRSYFLEIQEDNSLFQKHQNISDEQFVTFFDSVISVLDETLSTIESISEETCSKISSTFMNFIYKILSQKDKSKLLKTAKEKFVHILNLSPKSLFPVFRYLNENTKLLQDVLLNESPIIVQNHSELIFEVLKKAFQADPNEFVKVIERRYPRSDDLSSLAVSILDFILDLFPRVPGRFVTKAGPILQLFNKLIDLGDEMVEYFIENEAITIFVTYILGKDSPCYSEFVVKGENWDHGRYNIDGVDNLVQVIYKIFKKTQNSNVFKLSERDLKSIRSPSFLKYAYKHFDTIFSELLTVLSFNNEDYTLKVCTEIVKYIDDISGYDENDFIKLFDSLVPLLKLNDEYQLLRFELLIGFPVIAFDDSTSRNPYPLFGYHKLSDNYGKLFEYRGLINNRRSCTILKKLATIKTREKVPCLIFIHILEACLNNPELMIYINRMISEEPGQTKFIDWGVNLVKKFQAKYETNIGDKLPELIQQWNSKIEELDSLKIKNFFGFTKNNYLHYNLSQEIYHLINTSIEGLFLFKVEYLTTVMEFNQSINFSKSYSYVPGVSLTDDVEKETNDNEDTPLYSLDETDNTTYSSIDGKHHDERVFLLSNVNFFENGNKNVSVYNPRIDPKNEEIKSTLIRYVLLNNTYKDLVFSLKISRRDENHINEYLPCGPIITTVNSNSTKTIYSMHKFDISLPWSEIDTEISAEWTQNSYHSNELKNFNLNGNSRYGAVGNSSYNYVSTYDAYGIL